VCWIQIDGKTGCPCKCFMKEQMVLGPMPKKKVIKDLVVELDPGESIYYLNFALKI
jgi:succinate dehydrogenase/fumarate reductase-like Fe-S protein